jgi:hypothetical protein
MNRLLTGLAALEFAGVPNFPGRPVGQPELCVSQAAAPANWPALRPAQTACGIPFQGRGRKAACYWPAIILGVINPM